MHKDFDAERAAFEATRRASGLDEPVTFTLGGERFDLLPDPTLGDTFDLANAPDVDPAEFDHTDRGHLAAVRALCAFIRRCLPVDQRDRWDQVLYQIPLSQQHVILGLAGYITEQVVNRPTEPSSSSSSSPRATGRRSNKRRAGTSVLS